MIHSCPICQFEYKTRIGLNNHWVEKHAPVSLEMAPATLQAQFTAAEQRADALQARLDGIEARTVAHVRDLMEEP